MILLEAGGESISEGHAMVLKHERKALGHAVVVLLVMLAFPAIAKDFGILTRIRRTTHSFAAHLPRFSYNIQHVMLVQLRRLWRTLRVNRMARYSGSISTVGCCSSFADRWSPPMPVYLPTANSTTRSD